MRQIGRTNNNMCDRIIRRSVVTLFSCMNVNFLSAAPFCWRRYSQQTCMLDVANVLCQMSFLTQPWACSFRLQYHCTTIALWCLNKEGFLCTVRSSLVCTCFGGILWVTEEAGGVPQAIMHCTAILESRFTL